MYFIIVVGLCVCVPMFVRAAPTVFHLHYVSCDLVVKRMCARDE